MTQSSVHNINVASQTTLIAPNALRASVPVDDATFDFVSSSRATISNILDRKDHRLIVVVGPCSIHDRDAAMEYANRLKALAQELNDSLYIVMRVYFENRAQQRAGRALSTTPTSTTLLISKRV